MISDSARDNGGLDEHGPQPDFEHPELRGRPESVERLSDLALNGHLYGHEGDEGRGKRSQAEELGELSDLRSMRDDSDYCANRSHYGYLHYGWVVRRQRTEERHGGVLRT